MRMWGGRFTGSADSAFMAFTSSLPFDRRLYDYDIRCSMAWVNSLKKAKFLTEQEESSILGALSNVKREMDEGVFKFAKTDEDIHTAVERRVRELIGDLGGKMRTGRSRNDQVATDMRLFVMDECREAILKILDLIEALVDLSRSNLDIIIPGHTHLQQAQPVRVSHLLLAFAQMLRRDSARFEEARKRADVLPLGSGAFAGTSISVDRDYIAGILGFSSVSDNSVDAVSDRDYVLDALFAASVAMVHLSRLGEQIILWCSDEFGLLELDDSWSTGSSLMPHKKNPDGMELVRGKTGRAIGNLTSLLICLKALPLAYNRDLQEDKEALFDSLDTLKGSLEVMTGTVSTMRFNRARAAESLSAPFLTATDLAEFLVSKGLEFPKAHEIAGEIVSFCISQKKSLLEISFEKLRTFSPLFDETVEEWLKPEAAVERKRVKGAGNRDECLRQIRILEKFVKEERQRLC